MKAEKARSLLDIVNHYTDAEPPINLVAIANNLGLTIRGDNLSSEVMVTLKRERHASSYFRFTVIINQSLDPLIQRFALAIALGHYIANKYFIGDGIQINSLGQAGLTLHQEVNATNIANEILMPSKHISKFLKRGMTVEKIANILRVIPLQLETRIRLSPILSKLSNN